MEKITLKNAQAFIKKMQDEYNRAQKFKVLGKTDTGLQALAGLVKDNNAFTAIKRFRIQETAAINGITASADSDGIKAKRTAEATLTFIDGALRTLKNVSQTEDARTVVGGYSSLATELKNAVTKYTEGVTSAGADGVRDQAFADKVKALADRLGIAISSQKPRLIAKKIFYSVPASAGLKLIKEIKTLLTPISSPSSFVPPSTNSTFDVTI